MREALALQRELGGMRDKMQNWDTSSTREPVHKRLAHIQVRMHAGSKESLRKCARRLAAAFAVDQTGRMFDMPSCRLLALSLP